MLQGLKYAFKLIHVHFPLSTANHNSLGVSSSPKGRETSKIQISNVRQTLDVPR